MRPLSTEERNCLMLMANSSKTDQAVLDSVLNSYPGFLQKGLSWALGPDPPDFIATGQSGERFGLEMTEWLNKSQTSLSISNQESRLRLINALDSERIERPVPITRVVICDRLDVPFRPGDRVAYVREVYELIGDHAPDWERNQAMGIWNISDLSQYPTLAQYCLCISLYGPPRFCKTPLGIDWNPPGVQWIIFEPTGTLYDPQWSADALIACILAKTGKYLNFHQSQRLDQFALLVHYGIRGIIHNTPYRGRNATLDDAVKQAHRCLVKDHGAFDSAYLYMNFNGGKLVQLFPNIVILLEFSHQPGQH